MRGEKPQICDCSQHCFLPLSRGAVVLLDTEDAPLVSDRTWHLHHTGYATSGADPRHGRKFTLMHRMIAGTPKGVITDHESGDKLDNRRGNLRDSSPRENSSNRKKPVNGSAPYKGITRHKRANKWMATIKVASRSIYLGLFDDPADAARAYDNAAITHHGQFARTNAGLGLLVQEKTQ